MDVFVLLTEEELNVSSPISGDKLRFLLRQKDKKILAKNGK